MWRHPVNATKESAASADDSRPSRDTSTKPGLVLPLEVHQIDRSTAPHAQTETHTPVLGVGGGGAVGGRIPVWAGLHRGHGHLTRYGDKQDPTCLTLCLSVYAGRLSTQGVCLPRASVYAGRLSAHGVCLRRASVCPRRLSTQGVCLRRASVCAGRLSTQGVCLPRASVCPVAQRARLHRYGVSRRHPSRGRSHTRVSGR
ncbi:unnamed protein product [Arctogadus glacialis]